MQTYLRVLNCLLITLTVAYSQNAWAQGSTIANNRTAAATSHGTTQIDISNPPEDHEGPSASNVLSFYLAPLQVTLDKEQKEFLSGHALPILRNNPDIVLIIQSLARSNPDDRYEKTRIALARGLEVRQFFLDHDVSPKQVKTQPLPATSERSEDDRVDLIFVN